MVVILMSGYFNSVYYEYSFLVNFMGVELVEGSDLFVDGGFVYMCMMQGLKCVDVIYCWIDDLFFDFLCFCKDFMLGVLGLMDVYCLGGVFIVLVFGVGVVDDKVVYIFVLEMICFYLGEELFLQNVQIWMLWKDDDYKYVMDNLKDLVVKEVYGLGGYGMLIGFKVMQVEIDLFVLCIKVNFGNYIVQLMLVLLISLIFVDEGVVLCYVDLWFFCLCGDWVELVQGGLICVVLREGLLVVNLLQGGGVKDIWVLLE